MHHGALVGEDIRHANSFGWQINGEVKHNWQTLVDNVGDYIASQSFGHRSQCMEQGIEYFNELVSFVDEHTVECVDKRGNKTKRTSDKFLISVGGRPNYPDTPGAREVLVVSSVLLSLFHFSFLSFLCPLNSIFFLFFYF